MKLIAIMSLRSDRDKVREIFEKHDVEIFSELDIEGHTRATLKEHGWWPTRGAVPNYSTLCFAVVAKLRADEIMSDLQGVSGEPADPHPLRAFQVDVERMI